MGSAQGRDLQEAGREPQHGGQVRRHGRHVAVRPSRRGSPASRNGCLRGLARRPAGGGPGRAEETAPHRQEDLRQAGGRAGLRGLLLVGVPLRGEVEGGERGPVRARRLPGARVGAGSRPGRLRQLPLRDRRGRARHEAARSHPAPFQRALLQGDVLRALGVPLRRAAPHLRVDRPGPGAARAGQRDRGGEDGARAGHRVRPVLPVQGPLPMREPLPQPLFGQREGLGGERRGVPEAQPPGAAALRRLPGRAQRDAPRGLRAGERRRALPRRQADRRGASRGPLVHAGPSGGRVRLREVGQGQVGQARLRGGLRQPLLRGAGLARPGARRWRTRRERRGARRARPQGGRAAKVLGGTARWCATRPRPYRRWWPGRGPSASRR